MSDWCRDKDLFDGNHLRYGWRRPIQVMKKNVENKKSLTDTDQVRFAKMRRAISFASGNSSHFLSWQEVHFLLLRLLPALFGPHRRDNQSVKPHKHEDGLLLKVQPHRLIFFFYKLTSHHHWHHHSCSQINDVALWAEVAKSLLLKF